MAGNWSSLITPTKRSSRKRRKTRFLFLLTDEETSKESIHRLKILEEYQDGFIIAEKDLINRGEGDIIGRNQSGTKFRKIAAPEPTCIRAEKSNK